MEAITTEVAVEELVIDMPLSEQNVQQKVQSLQTSGLIQPLTVWAEDQRIIDGFHRLEAARRLGWETITCYVIQCDEEAFWDARIQSARQHHDIKGDRLVVWVQECWKATRWSGQEDLALSLPDGIWRICARIASANKDPRYNNDFFDSRADWWHSNPQSRWFCGEDHLIEDGRQVITDAQRELLDWLMDKARRWCLSLGELREAVFMTVDGYEHHWVLSDGSSSWRQRIAKTATEHDLGFVDSMLLEAQFRMLPSEDLAWAEAPFKSNVVDEYLEQRTGDETPSEYFARLRSEGEERQRKQEEQEEFELAFAEAQRQVEKEKYLKSPEGHKEAARNYARSIEARSSNLFWCIEDGWEPEFAAHVDPALIASIATWALRFMHEKWPDANPEPTETEVVRLRQALAEEIQRRVQAEARLEGLELTRAQVRERLPHVMAWSGDGSR